MHEKDKDRQKPKDFTDKPEEYDRWYDSAEGRAIFDAEMRCFQLICPQLKGRWLEVGVGTGRFASALGISEGLDPSPRMLEIAGKRGIHTTVGPAENLPCGDGAFDGILLALTLCFVSDAQQTLDECRRVLRPGGSLVTGIVPADSPWGRAYIKKASENHPVYSQARFRTAKTTIELARNAEFALVEAASTLLWTPGEAAPTEPRIETGILPEAGFVALMFAKTTPKQPKGAHTGDN